jgi:peptidoglycan/LPS O-acetylase OafA/YrhL
MEKAPTSLPASRPHRPGLDLLRAMSAYVVVTAHCSPALIAIFGTGSLFYTNFMSIVGVEIFFALSGFLIGGILLDLQPTAANLRNFIWRRWFRTLPVYYFVLILYLAFPSVFHDAAPSEPWRYFVFFQNIANDPKFFGVSWSLSIEEWFYLLLPLCLFLRIRYLHAIVLLIVVGITLRYSLPVDVRASVLGRLDAIAYGCLAAWLMRTNWHAAISRHAGMLAIIAMAGMVVVYSYIVLQRMQLSRLAGTAFFTLLPLLSAMAIPYFAGLRIGLPGLARVTAFCAAISYPLYVCHTELIYALSMTPFHAGTGFYNLAAAFLGATAVAYLIHVLIEKPFMRLRPKAPA